MQAGGSPRAADLGEPLWTAQVQSIQMLNSLATDIEAQINNLGGAIGTLYIWDSLNPYPKSDPGGIILGSSTVQIKSLGSDNKSIALKGLPAGYTINRGAKLAWDQGSSPVHRVLHELAEDITADGTGETAEFDLTTYLRAGASVDLVVTLKRAAAEMMIVPGTLSIAPAGTNTSTISFTAIQIP